MQYRFYLLDEHAHVRAGESFAAADDRDATNVAAWVHFACNDVFSGYELWRGTKRLSAVNAAFHDADMFDLESVAGQRQENILDLEDQLQRTFLCVNQSRRLLEMSARLHRRWSR